MEEAEWGFEQVVLLGIVVTISVIWKREFISRGLCLLICKVRQWQEMFQFSSSFYKR